MPSLLNKVMQLKPVSYEMKRESNDTRKSLGFIAQDVKLLFPELVHITQGTGVGYGDISDLHMMSYSGFGVLAIKAIQEQQQIIDDLKARLEKLEKLLVKQ
ncbi:MAG: hypothetical protein JWQ09_4108, partial [Segetibacter sp.]|nr:hypothetical protein [Segetibacter sp.]